MRGAAATTTLIALLAVASPASGDGDITPVDVNRGPADWYGGIGGPVFAGEAIVWGRPVRAGYQVLVQRGDRAEVRTIRFHGIRDSRQYVARLSASSSRVALDLEVTACPGERGCESGYYPEVFNAALTGGLTGRFETLASGCGPADADPLGEGVVGSYTPVDVWRDVVAWAGCRPPGTRIRDYGPRAAPAGRDYRFGVPRVAGSYVARYLRSGVVVSNWRTATRLFRLPAASFSLPFDVDSDGTLALSDWENHDTVVWASPEHAEQHVIANEAARRVVVADRRVAYSVYDYDEGTTFHVAALGGSSVAAAHDDAAITWADYDGRRLTWITAPCATGGLVVWDGEGAPPRPPAGQCPPPSVVDGSARVDRHNRLSVRLRCPTRPWLGCAGDITARDPRYRGRWNGIGGRAPWASDRGDTTRVLVPRGSHAICTDRHGDPRTELVIGLAGRSDRPPPETERYLTYGVAVHGARRNVADCAA